MRRPARRLAAVAMASGLLAATSGVGAAGPIAAAHPASTAGHQAVTHSVVRARSTVDVRRLAAAPRVHGQGRRPAPRLRAPLRARPAAGGPAIPVLSTMPPAAGGRGAAGRLGQPGTAIPSLGAQLTYTQSGWPGIDEPTACGVIGSPGACGLEPPDPWVAVSADRVVQAVNTAIRITDRTGARPVDAPDDVSLAAFFGEGADQVVDSDPRVVYVPDAGRWLATELSFDCQAAGADVGSGHLYLMASDGADPAGTWTRYVIDFPGTIPDYPGVGWSADKIVLTANLYPITGSVGNCDADGNPADYEGATAIVLDRADVFAGVASVPSSSLAADPARFTWRPAQGVTDSAAYLVGLDATTGDVRYVVVTGTNAGADVAFTDHDLTVEQSVAPFGDPPQPHQVGAPGTIAGAVDARPTDAVWSGGHLWFVATDACAAGTGARDCVRLTELDTGAAGAKLDEFGISAFDTDVFMGGVGFAGDGSIHVVYSMSTPTGWVSTYAAYRTPTDPAFFLRDARLVSAGQATYPGSRWGDYVGVATDPSDAHAVWQADEYPAAGGYWATFVSQLEVGTVGSNGTTTRVSGADRYGTAAAVSAAAFAPGVAVAYVATGQNFPDALAGGPAASLTDGPLLLVTQSAIPSATQAELTRLAPKSIRVLGGSSVVSDGVLTLLHSYTTGPVTRLSGSDRYATAAAVSAATFPRGVGVVLLATGANYPDALSGGPPAALADSPLLLVTKSSVPAATAAELARLRPEFIDVLGGSSVVSDAVLASVQQYTATQLPGTVRRLSGSDRYLTAVDVTSSWYDPGVEVLYVATGTAFPDALSGGPAAALQDSPLLLVTPTSIPAAVQAEIQRLQPHRIVVLGGPGAVSNAVLTALQADVVP